MLFDRAGRVVASAQREHEQLLPQPGWVEHDAKEIWFRSDQVIRLAPRRPERPRQTSRRSHHQPA